MKNAEKNAFDVIVIGCGPAGERAALYAAREGKRVAVIERYKRIGGTRVNWGTIPSKTLRESAMHVHSLSRGRVYGIRGGLEAPLTIADLMSHEKDVVEQELELIQGALDRQGIQIFRGHGAFVDPHTIAVLGREGQTRMLLTGKIIVIAVGTTPNRPADVPFDNTCILDSNKILEMKSLPRSMLVLGAGVIGVEYTSIFSALGIEVTLVDTRKELLPFLDREIAEILEREMQHMGVAFLHDDHYAKVERRPGNPPGVRCTTRNGNVLEAEVMLYSVGRDGNTSDLGLENVGIEATKRGLIQVNESYQTPHPHIYAVGDVIGYPALASTSMEQGRQAMQHALDLPGKGGVPEVLPFAIFAIPEVSHIGETEQTLKEKGVSYFVGRGLYARNPRGLILGDRGGVLKLLFEGESLRLVGAHIIGTHAFELIHTGQAYLRMNASADQMAQQIFNYPSLSDLYRHAAMEALNQACRRYGSVSGRKEPYQLTR
jgi:NAD(P) transhydrogenase